jgi:dipeptidyl aminopeptidase/acylaminoacyl peptidase
MQPDYRDHPLFKDAEARTRAWLRPGENVAVDLVQVAASPDGRQAAGAAVVCEVLEGAPSTRIALVDLESGSLEIVTHGPNSDSAPKWSPDGRTIAFLSDREQAYMTCLRLFDPATGTDRATCAVNGFVESLQWSADGGAILLGVAGFGADLAGAQGGFSVAKKTEALPSWSPTVEGAPDAAAWRSSWLYDVATDTARQISPHGVNVWEAVWCGPGHVAAICSDSPDEGAWYTANVRRFAPGGPAEVVFSGKDQLGWLSSPPSGARLAVVEAVCSDRTIVAGDLRLIELATGAVTQAETLGADAVSTCWRGEDQILFSAAEGPDNLFGLYDRLTGKSTELRRDRERTASGSRFPEISPRGAQAGGGLFVREACFEAPVLVALEDGKEREVVRFGSQQVAADVNGLGTARDFAWTAPDGQTIHGWLMTPPGKGPHPLVMEVHGGPVWFFKPRYVGKSALHQMLLAAGYAILQPNPRGSSGRGQAFARHVFGDMGGADTYDYLSGLDALVAQGIADPARIGVTGGSYGGFMSSWLITQDQRFAAAVPVAPVTDWVSEHLTCHIPYFCEIFLDDNIDNPTGKYFTRSPIHFADRVKTPTLNICGALDKNTPAVQAVEFHHALLLNGVESVLVTYPEEGHGVRRMPATFDYMARVVDWFKTHMPA